MHRPRLGDALMSPHCQTLLSTPLLGALLHPDFVVLTMV